MLNLMVVPDYLPDQFSTWYLLNNYLQKSCNQNISLMMPATFTEVAKKQEEQPVGMLYVNPFDAGKYVREQDYLPVVRPKNRFNEVVIVCAADSPLKAIEDLHGDVRLALSHNQDANFIGMRLLEPAGLSEQQLKIEYKDNSLIVTSALIRDQADIGVIQADVFASFNPVTQKQIRVLLKSKINELSHVWLMHSSLADQLESIRAPLIDMINHEDAQKILKGLGLPNGFEALDQETMEFMIDVVDTLRS